MKCLYKPYEVYHQTSYMSSFGGNHALYIYDDCNINTNSYSNLGYQYGYEAPNGYAYGSTEAKNYLAGCYNFTVCEIEVFKLIWKMIFNFFY